MARNALVAVLILVVATSLLVIGGGVAAGDGTGEVGLDSDRSAFGSQEIDADRVRLDIEVHANGDATWSVELWTRLDDDERRDAFDELRAEIDDDPDRFVDRFDERMTDTASAAAASTGREMAIENVTVSTRTETVPTHYGVVTYTFEWHGFAAVDGAELHAGDAIDGLLLSEGTRLTVRWPEAYRVHSVDPDPDDRPREDVAVWRGGETDFVSGQPRLVLTSAQPGVSDDRLAIIAVVTALALIGVLAWLATTGRLPWPRSGTGSPDADDPTPDAAATSPPDEAASDVEDDPASVDSSASDDSPPATETEDSTSAAEADGSSSTVMPEDSPSAAETGDPNASGEEPPPDLLSNEEQVVRLLERNGGRMKQQEIVAELGWTEAKTSQVVTKMREDGELDGFRIGRENVLTLPGKNDI